MCSALTGGGMLHVLPHEVATDVDAFADYFRRHRIDAVKLVPSHLEALAGRGAGLADVLPRRLLICAGEPLRWDLVARVRAAAAQLTVHNHYGPTETTVSMLGAPVPAGPLAAQTPPTVPLGTPFGNVGAHVLDRAAAAGAGRGARRAVGQRRRGGARLSGPPGPHRGAVRRAGRYRPGLSHR
jgi:non-ribosomal peptide synthetase component F